MTPPTFYTRSPRLLAATDQTIESIRHLLARNGLDLDTPDVRAAFIVGLRLAAQVCLDSESSLAGVAGLCVLANELEG